MAARHARCAMAVAGRRSAAGDRLGAARAVVGRPGGLRRRVAGWSVDTAVRPARSRPVAVHGVQRRRPRPSALDLCAKRLALVGRRSVDTVAVDHGIAAELAMLVVDDPHDSDRPRPPICHRLWPERHRVDRRHRRTASDRGIWSGGSPGRRRGGPSTIPSGTPSPRRDVQPSESDVFRRRRACAVRLTSSSSPHVRPSLDHSRSNAASAASVKPWRLRKLYRQRCWLTVMPSRSSRPTLYVSHAAICASVSSSSGGASPKPPLSRSLRAQQHAAERGRGGGLALLARLRRVFERAALGVDRDGVADLHRDVRAERRRLVDLDGDGVVRHAERRRAARRRRAGSRLRRTTTNVNVLRA